MINLIPNEEKKKMLKDFYLRLVIVFLTMLGLSLFVASLAILPSYFISSTQKSLVNTKLETAKSGTVSFSEQEILKEAEKLNSKLGLLEKARENKFVFSEKVLNEIILKKMPDIKLNRISYGNDPKTGRKVILYGQAPSRERLLLFRKILEENVYFTKVDLPISNFVQGSNIQFFMSLTPS